MTTSDIDRKMKDRIFREAYGPAWNNVKGREFFWQSGKGGLAALAENTVPDWDWSDYFHRWGASVILTDGWAGFSYPIIDKKGMLVA